MHILHAEYLTSATSAEQWPQGEALEIALVGRSNVGKSTLLNTLLGRKGLARVSGTPGRTRLLNFFTVTVALPAGPDAAAKARTPRPPRLELRLADLPGFGYAQVSRAEHARWQPMMEEYLTRRQPLRAVVLLCDGRRAAAPDADALLHDEAEIGRYVRAQGRQVIPVLTKADKLSKHERKPTALQLQRLLGQRVTVVSGQTGEGMDELWRRILSALTRAAAGAQDALDQGAAPT